MEPEERRLHTSTIPPPVVRDRTSSPATGLFSLPREIRDEIYRRVLVVADPLYLFQDSGSRRVETFGPGKPVRWLSLLYTNRQVYDEACAMLYRSSRFTLVDTTPRQVDLLQSFLDCIGSVNAGHLSYLCINFPAAEIVEENPRRIVLREDSLRSLELLQEKCTHLKTLEGFVHSQNSRGLTGASDDDPQFVQEALSQINAQLKAIPSLSKVIVRFHSGSPSPSVMEQMQCHAKSLLKRSPRKPFLLNSAIATYYLRTNLGGASRLRGAYGVLDLGR